MSLPWNVQENVCSLEMSFLNYSTMDKFFSCPVNENFIWRKKGKSTADLAP
jgi:hypothetical protein